MDARAAQTPQPTSADPRMTKADDMPDTRAIEERLRSAASLPDLLAASFDAFEAVRRIARDCEDRVPDALLAAFMTTADAAVDGREAITGAPSLAPHRRTHTVIGASSASSRSPKEVAGFLARLGALLRDQLTRAAPDAAMPADQAACADAALAAGHIWQLMAGEGDGTRPR
jgi:hypothetical protein